MSTNRTRTARLMTGAVALLAATPLLAGCPSNGSTDNDDTTIAPTMEQTTTP